MPKKKIVILIIVLIIIATAIFTLEMMKTRPLGLNQKNVVIQIGDSARQQKKSKKYEPAKEITAPAGYVNTDKITIQELVGKKVILVDFWTYSCINCQRTFPYLNSWYEKYKDQGLEIIGVHTPEFGFEKKIENVQWAVDNYKIKYPVVLDNDYGTWSAYNNRYWPRKYLIDIDGFIVYDHAGEGEYEITEEKIQELLKERKQVMNEEVQIAQGIVQPKNVEEVGFKLNRSPEIYFGASRNSYLGNGISGMIGSQKLTEYQKTENNALYLVGDWYFADEFAKNEQPQAKIIFKYNAAKVFMVARADSEVSLTIKRDGQVVNDKIAGADVVDGVVKVKADRLYRLIEDPTDDGRHVLEIIIDQAGLEAFTFTFG